MILYWIYIYLMSVIFSLVFVVYLARVPFLLSQPNSEIVDEYYNRNMYVNIPLDIFFIAIYLLIAFITSHLLRLDGLWSFMGILVLTTIVLTGSFWILCTTITPSQWFFSRWFHQMGWRSIVYDVILLLMVAMVMASFHESSF